MWILARNLPSAIVLEAPIGVSDPNAGDQFSVAFLQVVPSDLASVDPGGGLGGPDGLGRSNAPCRRSPSHEYD